MAMTKAYYEKYWKKSEKANWRCDAMVGGNHQCCLYWSRRITDENGDERFVCGLHYNMFRAGRFTPFPGRSPRRPEERVW